MKTGWFRPCGIVVAFVLSSCAPSSTDTLADAADKSATTIEHSQPTSTPAPSTSTAEEPNSVLVSPIAIPMTVAPTATSGESGTVATAVTELIQQVMPRNSELPDISYFAQNKSDRFLVDFEDIIAGHPHVGQRSPVPHNDAQVYFSNSDPRWIDATKPSDYPPIYAVSNGIVQLPDPPNYPYYNVIDHTNYDPPWWHVGYTIAIRIATDDGVNVNFLYSMEPYVNLQDKPMNFFEDFILVEDNQYVEKGDILGYMYVSGFSERLHGASSPHVAFALMRDQQGQWDVYAPAIFTEDIVNRFAELYRNPSEGWTSSSYGNDWSRGRGVPTGMGWMIDAAENPFGDFPLDVLLYDGIRDKEIDGTAYIDSKSLGFHQDALLFALEGNGDFVTETYSFDTDWRAIVASVGGPAQFSAIFYQQDGERQSSIFTVGPEQNFSMSSTPAMSPASVAFRISDPENWGWAIAVAPADSTYNLPGDNIPDGICPPGCPPLPSSN